jgi:hypothetical protein
MRTIYQNAISVVLYLEEAANRSEDIPALFNTIFNVAPLTNMEGPISVYEHNHYDIGSESYGP